MASLATLLRDQRFRRVAPPGSGMLAALGVESGYDVACWSAREEESHLERFRSTTVLGLVHEGAVALGGDGQVTFGSTVIKSNANKLRRLADGRVLAGFAGSAADGLQLFERFEAKLEGHGGNLRRAAVELAKDWRTDRILRRLEAQLAVLDDETALLISGSGDVLEPEDGIIAIGSGAPYALAAARALRAHSDLSASQIVAEALEIASQICIYTGGRIQVLELEERS